MKTLFKLKDKTPSVRWFNTLTIADVPIAGGKNASLGELVRALQPKGINIPDGFAVTAQAYRDFLRFNALDEPITSLLSQHSNSRLSLAETSHQIRALFEPATFPTPLEEEIREAYSELCSRSDRQSADVAVRSSATAEDLPDASFAGQQESFLNVSGPDDLLATTITCFSSLFTERAISYREQKGFAHEAVALSVGVQEMVRSDRGCSGVMFTIDPENGFPDLVVINASYGLGETIVQGAVTPDEFRVFKPLLGKSGFRPIIQRILGTKKQQMIYSPSARGRVTTIETPASDQTRYCIDDDDILKLAEWAIQIEDHYGHPMDIEWGLDGNTLELFILQARPETVQSRSKENILRTYRLNKKPPTALVEGLAIGGNIANGTIHVLESIADAETFQKGQILVASQTDPDWVPLMKQAAAIITDHGGRTSHAAIVSRELGVPAIIGTGNATQVLSNRDPVTVDCSAGQKGRVYSGLLPFTIDESSLADIPGTKTGVMLNIASPEGAMHSWRLPADGIGLARMEFIINNSIKVHPMALACFDELEDDSLKEKILELRKNYESPGRYFIDTLASGIATIAASRYPNPVVVRLSDFKTNEYAHLLGGEYFEDEEQNPMLGFRGASRYYSDAYRPGFELECAAIKQAREEMGFTNIIVMIPFCRTLEEASKVREVMAENDLKRESDDLRVYLMAEIPSNVILAQEFSHRIDGFSIGSNDLTQLVLGVDRDSERLAHLFDERDPAVKALISQLIKTAHACNTPVGICGQGPSDYPDFVEFLVSEGIDSISVTPDSFIRTKQNVARAEELIKKTH